MIRFVPPVADLLLSLGVAVVVGLASVLSLASAASAQVIRVGGTTSVRDSGLLAALQTAFTADTGMEMQFIVGGTGRVLKLLEAQDVSAALVHDRRSEEALVAQGDAVERLDVMRNDFIILGPSDQDVPADVTPLLNRIADEGLPFVSRGDNSGTHKAELRIWEAAGVDVADPGARRWYRKSGSGQGATLNIAASLDAFVLADGATWLAFENKANLAPKGCFGPSLANVYGVLVGYDGADVDARGQVFAQWLTGPGQQVIAAFRIGTMAPFLPLAEMNPDGPLPTAEAFCRSSSS